MHPLLLILRSVTNRGDKGHPIPPSDSMKNDEFPLREIRLGVLVASHIITVVAALFVFFFYKRMLRQVDLIMSMTIVFVMANYLSLKIRLLTPPRAALIFAALVYGAITSFLIATADIDLAVLGFFPAVLGAFFFLGTRLGIGYTLLLIATLTGFHLSLFGPDLTGDVRFPMRIIALIATAVIAYAYEAAVISHTRTLSASFDHVNRLARTDHLTGVSNRHDFFTSARRHLRGDAVHTALMLDIDNFKTINDTYGHSAGDIVLCAVAGTIRDQLRETQLFGRIGGEEFAILLPVPLEIAHARAEEIRSRIAALTIPCTETVVRVTVSIGIAQNCPGDTIDTLLRRADTALYDAKHRGKNTVALSLTSPSNIATSL